MPSLRALRTVGILALATIGVLGLAACTATPTPTSVSTPAPSLNPGPTPNPSALIGASVTIAGVDVDGQHVTVAGFVSGIAENNGDCTFTLTDTATKVAVTLKSTGVANVSTTTCGTHQDPISDFSQGTWSVRLAYKSSKADVLSPSVELQVP